MGLPQENLRFKIGLLSSDLKVISSFHKNRSKTPRDGSKEKKILMGEPNVLNLRGQLI